MKIETQLAQALKDQHLSLTRPRLVLCQLLDSHSPCTMRELVALAHEKDIDRATVYRSVKVLDEIGVIKRIQIGWKYKLELSDAFSHHHHHAHCGQCNQIVTLPEDDVLEAHIERIARLQQFKVQDHHLELQGICQNCQR